MMAPRVKHIVAILALLATALALPQILGNLYYVNLMILVWVYAILAISLNVYMGFLGGLTMACTAFFGLAGYTTGLLTTTLGWPTGVGLLAAMGICVAVASILGLPAMRLKAPYFILITLAFLGIIGGLSNAMVRLTGASAGLRGIPAPAIGIGDHRIDFNTTQSFYYLALAVLIVIYLLVHFLFHSRVGRGFIAVRDNEDLANTLGISPFRYKMTGFVASAVIAAVAGWLYAHYVHILDPGVFGFGILFNMTFMVILGGVGTLPGPVIGAIIVMFVPEVLRVSGLWRMSIFAVFMLVMIIFMPRGFWSFLQERWTHYQRPRGKPAPPGPAQARKDY